MISRFISCFLLLSAVVMFAGKVRGVLVETSGSGESASTIFRNYTTAPGATHVIGKLPFAINYNGGITTYSQMLTIIDDPTTGSQDGRLRFVTQVNGSMSGIVDINSAGLSVLEGGMLLDKGQNDVTALTVRNTNTGTNARARINLENDSAVHAVLNLLPSTHGTFPGDLLFQTGAANASMVFRPNSVTVLTLNPDTSAVFAGNLNWSGTATGIGSGITQLNASNISSGSLGVPRGGTGQGSVSQGDILYGSGTDTWSRLAKSTSATRYLANTGTSNNPAWAQVDLSNGVTGTLGASNGGTARTSWSTGAVAFGSSGGGLLEDAGNFIWNDTSNLLSIGSGAGSDYRLNVQDSMGVRSDATWPWSAYTAAGTGLYPIAAFYHSRGSLSSKSVPLAGDLTGDIRWFMYDGDSYENNAMIRIRAGNGTTVSNNDVPGEMEFYTAGDGQSASTQRMEIDHTGAVLIGNVDTPSSPLEGAGDLQVEDELYVKNNAVFNGFTRIDDRTSNSPAGSNDVASGAGDLYVEDNIEADGFVSVNSLTVGGTGGPGSQNLSVIGDAAVSGDLTISSAAIMNGEINGDIVSFEAGAAGPLTLGYTTEIAPKIGDLAMDTLTGRGFTCVNAGSIVGYSVTYDVTASTGSPALYFDIYKNTSQVWSTTINTSTANVKTAVGTQARGTDTFSASDRLSCRLINSGSGSTITVRNIIVTLKIIYN